MSVQRPPSDCCISSEAPSLNESFINKEVTAISRLKIRGGVKMPASL
jgi:hypothetical protein